MSDHYGTEFFQSQRTGSDQSAQIIVPWIVDLVKPASVVDVGCGIGTWAAQYHAQGIHHVLALDGDYVDRTHLLVPSDMFQAVDLGAALEPRRFGKFDLANCLEVAEHLPSSSADHLVDFLCGLSDVVLFGAAIPWQGGTHHVNEQWQSYWIDRFALRDFKVIDAIRPKFWHDSVEWWYLQNTFLFCTTEKYGSFASHQGSVIDAVHPRLYERRIAELLTAHNEIANLRKQVEHFQNQAPLGPKQ